jgi:hypothetical protein
MVLSIQHKEGTGGENSLFSSATCELYDNAQVAVVDQPKECLQRNGLVHRDCEYEIDIDLGAKQPSSTGVLCLCNYVR